MYVKVEGFALVGDPLQSHKRILRNTVFSKSKISVKWWPSVNAAKQIEPKVLYFNLALFVKKISYLRGQRASICIYFLLKNQDLPKFIVHPWMINFINTKIWVYFSHILCPSKIELVSQQKATKMGHKFKQSFEFWIMSLSVGILL